ncbi:MAG TPA: hypothetical protein VET85_10395 [Stellaceae bacterium]|nr:hypothetical protein [Stellaceae bacterium]
MAAILALWAILATVGAPLAPALAETAKGIHDIAAETIDRLGLQRELPRVPEPPSSHWRIAIPDEIVWLILVGGAALLFFVFYREVTATWRRSAGGGWDPVATGGAASARAPAMTLAQADDLARQGRFVEAMHVLLLQSLIDIRDRLGEKFADSLTSREILSHTKLSPEGRTPLREIIARVELTYFGARPAGAVDYAACRARFDELAQAMRRDAATMEAAAS